MPWKIVETDGKFCVHKENQDKSAGKLLKCYDNKKEATSYLRALYANVEESLSEFSMFISKSSIQDGLMKWSAVNSDTSKDLYGERMTLGLYQKMLSYIKEGTPPPEDFREMVCSDYWCGGMPYLSIAHYSDMNGSFVPGQPLELFIDGTQLKAKGILFDSPLGRRVWKSLKLDEEIKTKSGVDDERIRISIAFLDLAHKHGEDGTVFERKSITSVCPECAKGIGNKIYLDGYLVHLALTRKPVNPRTIMEPEDAMAKKSKIETRQDDAVSIVGEDIVEEVTKSALEAKSDALIEMSDTEPVVEESKMKDSPSEDESDPMDEEEDSKEKKSGKKECSLTDGDIEVIRGLILEALPKAQEPAPVAPVRPVTEKSALDLATDELYNSINAAIQLQGASVEQRLESINPALQALGNSISALVRESMGVSQPAPVANDQAMILEAITSVSNSVEKLTQEVAVLKAQTTNVQVAPKVQIPAPRAIQPAAVVAQSQAAPVNPNSIANIVRRSVSKELPLK